MFWRTDQFLGNLFVVWNLDAMTDKRMIYFVGLINISETSIYLWLAQWNLEAMTDNGMRYFGGPINFYDPFRSHQVEIKAFTIA